jgi:hypothetical protein
MDDKYTIKSWNMDESGAVDPQLAEIKQQQSISASSRQVGDTLVKQRAEEADIHEQVRQMTSPYSIHSTNPLDPTEAIGIKLADAALLPLVRPRGRLLRMIDSPLVLLAIVLLSGVIIAAAITLIYYHRHL